MIVADAAAARGGSSRPLQLFCCGRERQLKYAVTERVSELIARDHIPELIAYCLSSGEQCEQYELRN